MTGHPSPDRSGSRERGAVLPSPVVLLTIVAVAFAAIAYFATRGEEPTEREITTASQEQPTATPTHHKKKAETEPPPKPKKTKPPVVKADHGVVVFNNTSVAGLASEVLARVDEAGWTPVAADNWYGTVPATTVYFPADQRDAAQKLALDLGVERIMPADEGMSDTNLTVILTGALD